MKKKFSIGRTRFGDIIAEFMPPARRSKRSDKVIIFCGGMPSGHDRSSLIRFFSQKGYWIFVPRYRGSWESAGRFLKISPERDILDVIDALPRGFKNLWNREQYRVKPSAIYLIGSSFGGPAAILASRDKRVKRVVALSPIIDWRVLGKVENLDWMEKFVQRAFGEAYRFVHKDWIKLKTGKFYNPAAHARGIDGRKIFLVHAKDDTTVPYQPTVRFAKATGSKLMLFARGGHFSSSIIMKPAFWKRIKKFLSASK